MPTYEYVCRKCGHEFEASQKMSDAPLKRCPECKKGMVQRKISGGAGLIFKGSGFYITDYRSEGYKSRAKADSTAAAAAPVASTASAAKADTKKATPKTG